MADEAPSSRKSKPQNYDPLAESTDDILVAARKLMQLGGEKDDDNNKNNDVTGKRKRVSFSGEEEVDQRLLNNDTTSAKIKETFGNDVEVIARPKKMQKYREAVKLQAEVEHEPGIVQGGAALDLDDAKGVVEGEDGENLGGELGWWGRGVMEKKGEEGLGFSHLIGEDGENLGGELGWWGRGVMERREKRGSDFLI
ncbi:hypothetical protein E2542_SST20727 [Spatholobus suberectus]|nr:hypothetical protein E2542_SST20727 [Spatholobus suberectus]